MVGNLVPSLLLATPVAAAAVAAVVDLRRRSRRDRAEDEVRFANTLDDTRRWQYPTRASRHRRAEVRVPRRAVGVARVYSGDRR